MGVFHSSNEWSGADVLFSPNLPGNTNTVCPEPIRLISSREEREQGKAREKLLVFWGFP